ncbi:MAG: hypothetical protein RR486_08195 [Clostridium sp.]|uniref:hypothetical protein n=1 Tax=Clostridium sp. TaxID=1506 RepID=UPI00305B8FA2
MLPSSPATIERINVEIKLWLPREIIIPAAGIIIPGGMPGTFRYSRKTIINMTIIPYCDR